MLHINEIHVAQWNTIKSNPENVLVKLAPFKEEYAITDPTFVALLAQTLSFEVENGKIHYNNPVNYNIFNRRTRLDISSKGLTSLEEIEYFESLEILYCEKNKISEIDLSLIPNLKSLYCYGNLLTALDVSMTTRLHDLQCGDQKNSRGSTQKLTLTLRADQQDFWLTQKFNYSNDVSVETNVLP